MRLAYFEYTPILNAMNTLRTMALLALLTALFLWIGHALGGMAGLVIAFIFAAAMNIGSYWFSDKLVLRMYRAREASRSEAPELYSIVSELAQRASMPMPRVYIVDSEAPNAFATGRGPEHAAVAATIGLLRMLTREELTGVLAHELSHVRHRDTLVSAIAATLGGAIAMLANMAQWALIFGGLGGNDDDEGGMGFTGALVMMIVAPIAATLIQLAVSRSREYGADDGGAQLTGHPPWLANALRKLDSANQRMIMPRAQAHPATSHLFIVNPLKGGFAKLFSTHPPIEERIRRLESMAR